VGIRGQRPPNIFVPPNCVVARKICFKNIIKTKILPSKNVFCPPNLETGYRPVHWHWFAIEFINAQRENRVSMKDKTQFSRSAMATHHTKLRQSTQRKFPKQLPIADSSVSDSFSIRGMDG